MAKPERLEDLGIIRVKLDKIIEKLEWFDRFRSKHDDDNFLNYLMKGEVNASLIPESAREEIWSLHADLRFLVDKIEEVYYIAKGDIE